MRFPRKKEERKSPFGYREVRKKVVLSDGREIYTVVKVYDPEKSVEPKVYSKSIGQLSDRYSSHGGRRSA